MKMKTIITKACHVPQSKGVNMSLKVPAALLVQAEQGEVREEDFLACIRESLP